MEFYKEIYIRHDARECIQFNQRSRGLFEKRVYPRIFPRPPVINGRGKKALVTRLPDILPWVVVIQRDYGGGGHFLRGFTIFWLM